MLGDDVDRGGLELDEIRVGVDALELLARAGRGRARLRETWTTSASRWSVGAGPVVKTATRPVERLERAQPRDDEVERRPALGVEDEVADQRAVRVQARARSWRDEDARVDVAIGGIAAPLPSKTTTSGSSEAASRAPSSTFDANGAPAMPAAGAPAADRRHARERRRLEMVGRGVPSGARERDEVVDASAASRRAPAPPARPGPSRRRRRCGRARAAARRGR